MQILLFHLFRLEYLQVPQVQFIPGLDACGGSDKPALISTLTYTTPTPQDLYDELSWSSSDFFILQKEDG